MKSITSQATKNIFSRLVWKVYPTTAFSIFTLIAIIPCSLFLPEKFAWENFVIENFQLLILAITFIFALKAKVNKNLFRWFAIIIFILFLREINAGRTFILKDGIPNSFYSWEELLPNMSYLSNLVYASIIIYALYYFFKHKLFRVYMQYVKYAYVAVWDKLLALIGLVLAVVGEVKYNNVVFEEMSETLFYVAFMSLIYLYSRNEKFEVEENYLL